MGHRSRAVAQLCDRCTPALLRATRPPGGGARPPHCRPASRPTSHTARWPERGRGRRHPTGSAMSTLGGTGQPRTGGEPGARTPALAVAPDGSLHGVGRPCVDEHRGAGRHPPARQPPRDHASSGTRRPRSRCGRRWRAQRPRQPTREAPGAGTPGAGRSRAGDLRHRRGRTTTLAGARPILDPRSWCGSMGLGLTHLPAPTVDMR